MYYLIMTLLAVEGCSFPSLENDGHVVSLRIPSLTAFVAYLRRARVQEQPKKVAVIGAGYIAVELAGVFESLGTDTTLVVRGDTPLRSFDDLLVETLVSEMEKSGLTLKPRSTTKVENTILA